MKLKFSPQRVLETLTGLAVGLGVISRFFHLSLPTKQVFDEVYFPVFANNYIHGISVFDVHPPLGKFLIALGIMGFGNVPFGWRIIPALFGCALVVLGAWLWWSYQKDRVGVLILTMLLALDTMLIVYSRTGLMDGIQLFFILASMVVAIRVRHEHETIWPAMLIGLAGSVKWVAFGVLAPVVYIMWRKKLLKSFLLNLPLSLALYLMIVYGGQVLNQMTDPWAGVWEWHRQALNYHLGLKATHPWSSQWWSWPLMLRPVLMVYETTADNAVQVVSTIGNPIVWWSSTVAVVISVVELGRVWWVKQKAVFDHPLIPLIIGYVAFFAPWVPIHRVVFIYHYIPSYAFALLMLVYWLSRAWKRQPWAVIGFMVVAAGFSLYYLPMAMGLPMTQESLQQHLWLKSWLWSG